MKHAVVCLIILELFLFSCKPDQDKIVTYDLTRRDFTEDIRVAGTTRAVKNLAITVPQVYAGILTVTRPVQAGTYVKKGDTLCVLESADLLEYYETLKEKLVNIKTDLEKLEADNAMNMSMLIAQVEKNKAQMAISQLDSVQIKYAPPVKQKLLELELKKTRIEESKLSKKLEAQKKIDDSEIRQAKSRIIQSENTVSILQDQINSLVITAPGDGLVAPSESNVVIMISGGGSSGTFGGGIKEGTQVMSEMGLYSLPDLSEMEITAEVPEVEYKRIEKGQKVQILIEAPEKVYTTGTIKMKSLVGKTKRPDYDSNGEPINPSKVKFYDITVSIDSCHSHIKPGITAECEILINQVKDTIVVPTMAIFERDSAKWVYVSQGEKFVRTRIETGLSSSSSTIITKGLKGDESISLMEPPLKYIEKSNQTEDE
jgi:multidrug efflux pump subunit AcrA (membrane-fusion protein)